MLDSVVLKAFIDNFVGYGNPHAPVWFIGMEEGGGASEKEIAARLAAWDLHGRQPLEDLADFHVRFGDPTRFCDDAAIQSTWNKIIRALLVAEGTHPTADLVRQYQIERLGRANGNAALLELLPLPSPSRDEWRYDTWSDLPVLASRATYEASVLAHRIATITSLIDEYKPRAVIFYGRGFANHWEEIAGTAFPNREYPLVAETSRLYMLLPHPVSFGNVNAHFEAAGRMLSDRGIGRGS